MEYSYITQPTELPEFEAVVGVDVETNGLNPLEHRPLLLQVADTQQCYIFDLRALPRNYILQVLEYLASHTCVFHNAKFDLKFLMYHYGFKPQEVFDTMVAKYLTVAGKSSPYISLKTLVAEYLNIVLSKEQQDSFLVPTLKFSQEQLEYAAQDALMLLPLYRVLLAELEELNLMTIARMEFKLLGVVAAMELHGVLIDTTALEKLIADLEVEAAAAEKELFVIAGKEFNPRSPKQVKELFHGLGMAVESTGEDAIKFIDHPFPQALLKYRKLFKLLSSFGKTLSLHIQPDGRIRSNFNQIGTTTGRFSSSEINLQNIPATQQFRSLFIAPSGHKIITADFSQIELRLAGILSGEESILEEYRKPDADLHRLTASKIFQISPEAVTSEMRKHGKTGNFSCVPLSTEILTRDGWKKHSEVSIGEEVMGYDIETDTMRWTSINNIIYTKSPVYRYYNNLIKIDCTEDHRWYVETRRGRNRTYKREVSTLADRNSEQRIIAAAKAETDRCLDITPEEAGIISWLFTDGSISISPVSGNTSQSFGKKVHYLGRIFQSPSANSSKVNAIKRLLNPDTYTYSVNKSGIGIFYLKSSYVRDLFRRSRLDEISLLQFVLNLDSEQRREFVRSSILAEGWNSRGRIYFTQNEGEEMEAFRVAFLLNGMFPKTRYSKSYTGNMCGVVSLNTRYLCTTQRLKEKLLGEQDVWCVQTGLGTWVMRQDDGLITITGNCAYGTGANALAVKQGISLDLADKIVSGFWGGYPKFKTFVDRIGLEVTKTGCVRTALGRVRWFEFPHSADPAFRGKIAAIKREAANFVIQGLAADIMKYALILVQQALPEGSVIIMTVHDELVVETPAETIDEVAAIVKTQMELAASRIVKGVLPIPANIAIGDCWIK